MNPRAFFLLRQSIQYIHNENWDSADLMLRQAIKIDATNYDVVRLLGVVAAKKGDNHSALKLIDKAILLNPRDGIIYSNKGNILLALGHPNEAVIQHKRAIKLLPNYAEAHSNLGNAFQELADYSQAIDCYLRALEIDPNNLEFICNLGNAFLACNLYEESINAYHRVLSINKSHPSANFYLSQIDLMLGNFTEGWARYEYRWQCKEFDCVPLKTLKKLWNGTSFCGRLYVWGEQGIGDQILYGSILGDLKNHSQQVIVAIDKRLIPIFQRSYPEFNFIDKNISLPECEYDQHIPMASLGQHFRCELSSFRELSKPFLRHDPQINAKVNTNKRIRCGIAWKSTNQRFGKHKSMSLMDLSSILRIKGIEFINLQYGDTQSERYFMNERFGINILDIEDLDLYYDIEGVLALINACDVLITTSNSIAHLSGALGKQTILLLPFSLGKWWYWHELNGISLWYPSVKMFKQIKQGEWSEPVSRAENYLRTKFGI